MLKALAVALLLVLPALAPPQQGAASADAARWQRHAQAVTIVRDD